MSTTALSAKAITEAHALHAFLTAWFRSAAAAPDFAELERVLAPGFRMVTPDGVRLDRDAVIDGIRRGRGTRGADFTITVLDPRSLRESDGAVLLEFVEQQYRAGETTRRISTALFTAEATAPRGVLWQHLHETWMK